MRVLRVCMVVVGRFVVNSVLMHSIYIQNRCYRVSKVMSIDIPMVDDKNKRMGDDVRFVQLTCSHLRATKKQYCSQV